MPGWRTDENATSSSSSGPPTRKCLAHDLPDRRVAAGVGQDHRRPGAGAGPPAGTRSSIAVRSQARNAARLAGRHAHVELDHRLRLREAEEREWAAQHQVRAAIPTAARDRPVSAIAGEHLAGARPDRRRVAVLERDHGRRRLELRLRRRRDSRGPRTRHGRRTRSLTSSARTCPCGRSDSVPATALMPPARTRQDWNLPVAPKRYVPVPVRGHRHLHLRSWPRRRAARPTKRESSTVPVRRARTVCEPQPPQRTTTFPPFGTRSTTGA